MRYVGERQIVIDDAPTPVPIWEFGNDFAGLTVVIIGGGPSHGSMCLDTLVGHRFVAVNSSCIKVKPIATQDDMLYFSDNSWNEHRPHHAQGWPGPVVTCNRNAKARLGSAVRRISTEDLCERLQVQSDCVGASSGHIAAAMACLMGARRIVLIGFEGRSVNGVTHGHSDYHQAMREDVFRDRFVPAWRGLALGFRDRGTEVVNASPDSAIPDFPFMSLEDTLRC